MFSNCLNHVFFRKVQVINRTVSADQGNANPDGCKHRRFSHSSLIIRTSLMASIPILLTVTNIDGCKEVNTICLDKSTAVPKNLVLIARAVRLSQTMKVGILQDLPEI